MTMEEGQAGVIGNEIDFSLAITGEHQYVLEHACDWLASKMCNFKAVPMQMDGVNVITVIPHANPASHAFFDMKSSLRLHGRVRQVPSIDRPPITPPIATSP